ncbi:serine/threonine-protein kinase [uncultured Draconibacterium sp.]|uniref:serine/threonine-protein kinase n=1 Tax=uncultured Draconibacterium sp. TaxID=1573823 RepID=UPI0032167510
MIKELINTSELSIISQGTGSEIKTCFSLKFDNKQVGEGGFGQVFEIIEIDNKPVKDLLVKIYFEEHSGTHALETITLLHKKVRDEVKGVEQSIYQLYSGLLGLPFGVFKADDVLENKLVVALVMFDLRKHGYREVNQDSENSFSLHELEFEDRFLIAHQFTKTFDFLHRKQFLHSDLDHDAFMYNPVSKHFAVIDYDSGYNYTLQDKASTWGKFNQLASVVWKKVIHIGSEAAFVTDEDRIAEENWKTAGALFEILFNVPPFFFLKDGEEDTFDLYIENNQWPFVKNKADEVVNTANIAYHEEVLAQMKAFEGVGFNHILQLFSRCFNEGNEKANIRPTSNEWFSAFLSVAKAFELFPAISAFSSDKTYIDRRDELVKFAWEVNAFEYLEVNGKIISLFENSVSIGIKDTTDVQLVAVSTIGEQIKSIWIEANKEDPGFETFEVSEEVRQTPDPVIITWKVNQAKHVLVQGFAGIYPINDQISVHPTKRTTYVLQAIGYFDQIVEKTITIDIIQPRIVDFNWKVDINKGINNVTLFWETEHSVNCKISPLVETVSVNGETDVKINSKTEFELTALGLFGESKRKLEAIPLNAPFVESILVEAPPIEITTHVDTTPLKLNLKTPEVLLNAQQPSIQLDSRINIKTPELQLNMQVPDFTILDNSFIPKLETKWFSKNYDTIKNKVLTSFSKLKSN